MVPIGLGEPNKVDEPYPVQQVTFGWAAGDAAYAMGSYDLDDDEALVLRGRSPECAFWNLCLWNQFMHTYNYDYERVRAERHPGRRGAGRVVDHRGRSRGSRAPELDLDLRPPQGSAVVPLVLPRRDPRRADGRGRRARRRPGRTGPLGAGDPRREPPPTRPGGPLDARAEGSGRGGDRRWERDRPWHRPRARGTGGARRRRGPGRRSCRGGRAGAPRPWRRRSGSSRRRDRRGRPRRGPPDVPRPVGAGRHRGEQRRRPARSAVPRTSRSANGSG